MKREIKFRMWSKVQKEGEAMSPGMDFKAWVYESEILKHVDGLNDRYVEIMQFTGLRDENDHEIYEGDILKGIMHLPQLTTWDTDENCNFRMGGEVIYDHSGFRLKAIHSMCDPTREGLTNYFDFVGGDGEVFRKKEIIGNIYENPELLK